MNVDVQVVGHNLVENLVDATDVAFDVRCDGRDIRVLSHIPVSPVSRRAVLSRGAVEKEISA